MIKGSIQEEDITIVNIYAPNIGSPQYIRQLLITLKGEINNNMIIVGDLSPHLQQWTDHPDRKIHKETQALNEALDQMDLIDIYRTFHPKATHSSQVHMEHSLRLITSWATNHTSVILRKLKSYQASFLTTMLYDWKSTTRKKLQKT